MTEFHSKLLQEMIDSITSCSYNNKSRNKNNFGNNLTGTKSNLLTDREKRKGPYNKKNKKNMYINFPNINNIIIYTFIKKFNLIKTSHSRNNSFKTISPIRNIR